MKKTKNEKPEISLFDSVYLAGNRISSYAREPEISIYVLHVAKVDIIQRIISERNDKKNYR